MARTHSNLILIGLGLALSGHLMGQNSTVNGHVRDERHRPVHGALVSISLSPPPGARVKPFLVSTKTGRDGTFSAAVPRGAYRICAQLPNSQLLDNCTWAPSANTVQTGGLQSIAAPAITLKRGYPIEVAVEDNGKVLSDLASKGPNKPLMIGIRGSNGMFIPLADRPKRGETHEYRMLVPRDTPLELSLSSREVTLADDKGAAVDPKKGAKVPIKLSGARTQRRFTFRVTGKQGGGKP